MSYKIWYQLEEDGDLEIQTEKNKDQVIAHLLYLLAQFEPHLLQLRYNDGYVVHYNMTGEEL